MNTPPLDYDDHGWGQHRLAVDGCDHEGCPCVCHLGRPRLVPDVDELAAKGFNDRPAPPVAGRRSAR